MVSQLVDMEWKFGVAAGSSEVRQSGDTFLQMKLSLDQGGITREHFMGTLVFLPTNFCLTLPNRWPHLLQLCPATPSICPYTGIPVQHYPQHCHSFATAIPLIRRYVCQDLLVIDQRVNGM